MTTVVESRVIERRAPAGRRDRVLLLSTSLLVDRMLQHTEFMPTAGRDLDIMMWTASRVPPEAHTRAFATCEPFPQIRPFREFPYNYLRRLNEFAWDAALKLPSRTSIERHTRRYPPSIRALKPLGRAIAAVGLQQTLEAHVERALLSYPRSPEAIERLQHCRPSVMLVTGPFQYEQPAVVSAARKLGIPMIAMIPSWDNLSTKNRMVFRYDGYIVWSSWMKEELHAYYPHSRSVPVYVVGAPQFDVFFRDRFLLSRESFCRAAGLDPHRPIVVYALGSPNFLKEHHGAIEMARRVARGEVGTAQLLVRPHPMFDQQQLASAFRSFGPSVVVQGNSQSEVPLPARRQDASHIAEWVNTFRHADVVINLGSTVSIDAALCDRPVVNLDFDPEPGQPNQSLVADLNHRWIHFRRIVETGGMWLVNGYPETVHAVRTYLERPELHREERQAMAALVCEHLDGRSGARLGEAIVDFARHVRTMGRT